MARLSGTPGFSLSTVVQLLAAEWGKEPERIEEALWRDFEAGVFDPSEEALANYNPETVEPSAAFACCWEVSYEDVDLLGNTTVLKTTLQTSKSNSKSTLLILQDCPYYFTSQSQFFEELYNDIANIIIPEKAIIQFSMKWGLPLPKFLSSEQELCAALHAMEQLTNKSNLGFFFKPETPRRRLTHITPKIHDEILTYIKQYSKGSIDRKTMISMVQKQFHVPRDAVRKIYTALLPEFKLGIGEKKSLLGK